MSAEWVTALSEKISDGTFPKHMKRLQLPQQWPAAEAVDV